MTMPKPATGVAQKQGERLSGKGARHYIVFILLLCLLFVVLEDKALDTTRNALRPSCKEATTSATHEHYLFDQAYDTAYSGMIHESLKSCNRDATSASTTENCLERKRVDFSVFPHKSQGGLLDEDREFVGELYYQAESVFEYGVGESTNIAAATNLPRYVGVDSSSEWLENVRENIPARFRLYFADVGPTKAWGTPTVSSSYKMALDYQLAPLQLETLPFDVYTIDGRWRVACVFSCMLHAISHGGNLDKIRFYMHDFKQRENLPGTKGYGIVKQVATIEHRVGRGVLLKKKANVTEDEIYILWEKYMHTFFR